MLNMGVVILDTDLCVRYWNNWMTRHIATDRKKIVGAKLNSKDHAQLIEKAVNAFDVTRPGGKFASRN